MKTQFKTWLIGYAIAPFSWSRWADICTFTFLGDAYLLQGKVNRQTNEKRFMVTSTSPNFLNAADVGSIRMERLKECGLINETIEP